MAVTVATGTSGNGPDAYIERVLREIDERGQNNVARLNGEKGGEPYAFPRTEGPCTLGDPRACLRWKDACPQYIRAPYSIISQEKFIRLIKQEAIEDRISRGTDGGVPRLGPIPLLVLALPTQVVWFLVAQHRAPPPPGGGCPSGTRCHRGPSDSGTWTKSGRTSRVPHAVPPSTFGPTSS